MAAALVALLAPAAGQAATYPVGFSEQTVFSGLTNPTAVRFASDGRVFVAEKSGLIKVFDSLSDPQPDRFADLRTQVHNFWDRGLLGLALDPSFPDSPHVYALYTHDAAIGGTAPRWGTPGATSDGCPNPPGATADGCVVSGRLSRLTAAGNSMVGSEQVLIEDWCQQYPSHSIGSLEFGPDGALWVVDMYREVIEHPKWIPEAWLKQLDVYAGNEQGRIYRILPKAADAPLPGSLVDADNEQLITHLQSPIGPLRDLDWRFLIERLQDESAETPAALLKLAEDASSPQGRVHALSILEVAGRLNDSTLLSAFDDSSTRRTSPGESRSQVDARNGPAEGSSQVWVIAAAPCRGSRPIPFR
jgi:hypothetical protein